MVWFLMPLQNGKKLHNYIGHKEILSLMLCFFVLLQPWWTCSCIGHFGYLILHALLLCAPSTVMALQLHNSHIGHKGILSFVLYFFVPLQLWWTCSCIRRIGHKGILSFMLYFFVPIQLWWPCSCTIVTLVTRVSYPSCFTSLCPFNYDERAAA